MKKMIWGLAFTLTILSTDLTYSQFITLNTVDTLQIYQNYINTLNANDISTLDNSVNKYRQLFEKSSAFEKDSAFIIFWRYYVTVADSLGAKYVQNEKYNSFINIKHFDEASTKNEKLKQTLLEKNKDLNEKDFNILKSVNHYGYKFDSIEGIILVSITDSKFILNNFTGLISVSLRQYITKVIEEIDSAENSDSAPPVTLNELVSRTLWWENFINNNPNFFLIDDCIATYNSYLYALMIGTGRLQAFDSNDQMLNDNFRKIYERIMTHHKGTKAAEIISKYYNILKKNNFIINREASKFAEQFITE
jgi:acyl carrier protein phosphodiesterase